MKHIADNKFLKKATTQIYGMEITLHFSWKEKSNFEKFIKHI
jgi:hypothetical protein